MAIKDLYLSTLTHQILDTLLAEGTTPTPEILAAQIREYLDEHDLDSPQFQSVDHEVTSLATSSAAEYNAATTAIHDDLVVAYQYLFQVSSHVLDLYERWAAEALDLERDLNNLEERIAALLQAELQGGDGIDFLEDNFANFKKVDSTSTTARVDTNRRLVSIQTDDFNASRQFADLIPASNIYFAILTKNYVTSSAPAPHTKLSYILDGLTSYWQHQVYTTRAIEVVGELKIAFDDVVTLSRIEVDLHTANGGSATQVLPLYSTNGHDWLQCSPENPIQELTDKGTFHFAEIEAKYIKFLLVKAAPDTKSSNFYIYEFGVDNIAFFHETLDVSELGQVLVTKALYSEDLLTYQPRLFSKIGLEVCEFIPDVTQQSIAYEVAGSNTENFEVSTATWVDIDPSNRPNCTKPTSVILGDLQQLTVSGLGISYSPFALSALVNPSSSFSLITGFSGTSPTVETATASGQRYGFQNQEDRILSHSFAATLSIVESSLEVWRNTSTKGSVLKVRDMENGWGKDGVYYKTNIYVANSDGIKIDFGSHAIILDETEVSGKVTIPQGRHVVKVHKDYWHYVNESGITTVAQLRAADRLYPYNHRYLIEGFKYPSTWPLTSEKPYLGFDIVAEHFMERVGVFDILRNCKATEYGKFALDSDAADPNRILSAGVDTSSTTVILLKVDPAQSDFLNETFTIRFKGSSGRYKYLRLRATLKTTDPGMSPSLSSYRIQLGDL